MHVAGDLGRGQFHHVRQRQFGQQFGHFGADHVRAQNLAVFLVHHDLDPAGIIAQPERLAVGLEGEAPTFTS